MMGKTAFFVSWSGSNDLSRRRKELVVGLKKNRFWQSVYFCNIATLLNAIAATSIRPTKTTTYPDSPSHQPLRS